MVMAGDCHNLGVLMFYGRKGNVVQQLFHYIRKSSMVISRLIVVDHSKMHHMDSIVRIWVRSPFSGLVVTPLETSISFSFLDVSFAKLNSKLPTKDANRIASYSLANDCPMQLRGPCKNVIIAKLLREPDFFHVGVSCILSLTGPLDESSEVDIVLLLAFCFP
jgi:hypothetical protein